MGDYLDYDEMGHFRDIFDDTGVLCEDYLITSYCSIDDINKELLNFGYIQDERLKNIGWS